MTKPPNRELRFSGLSVAPGDKLVKRREAAALYGCSEPTIRRFERDGSLPPVYIDAANVRWHSRNAVLALKEKRAAAAAGPAVEIGGDVAADAFAAYDDGATAADVVMRLRIAPNLARQLQDDWADLAGGFFVGGHVRAKLLEMLNAYDETNPVATGEDLLRLLDHMEVPRCASGCESWARFCMACFRNRPRQALQVVAQEVAAMEERKKRAAEREAPSARSNKRVKRGAHAASGRMRLCIRGRRRNPSRWGGRPLPSRAPQSRRRRSRARVYRRASLAHRRRLRENLASYPTTRSPRSSRRSERRSCC